MKLYSQEGGELMRIESLERQGNQLLVRGKVFGTMPITAALPAREVRSALKLLNWRLALFLVTLPFRRSPR
ncbi:MAG TPA: hypothetical protein VMU40_21170 [Steroidobacteraceae bacterium]|nr:hypothetical protein [Steroidobacteraceae bacterium]